MLKRGMVFLVLAILLLSPCPMALGAPVTALIPSQPSLDKNSEPPNEVDVLICLLNPFTHTGIDMDMPQFFAVLYYPENFDAATMQPEMRPLLGDVEQIRYLDSKAWGSNVAIDKPGLYQFVLEARPWFDSKRDIYLHQQAKVAMPAFGGHKGWGTPFGQSFEILPLTRPFGLTAPALFSAQLLMDGKELANVPIHMGSIHRAPAPAITKFHEYLEARTDSNGQFSFILNESGWWYCEASILGAPLKGPDGKMRDLERSTVFWLYVDAPAKAKK